MIRNITAVASMLVLVASLAFATQTPLTPAQLKVNNYSVVAGDLSLTFTACDSTNGNSFAVTGQEILLVQNSGASAYTFTLQSVADPFGRTDSSLTNYSVAASAITAVELKYLIGWQQTGGVMYTTCSNNALKFAVVRWQ